MNRTFVPAITTLLAVIVVGLAATGGVAAEDITVDVTVVDQQGDSIGSGAELTITYEDEDEQVTITETTAAGGVALFDVPQGADVEIAVDHPDYVRNFAYEIENASIPEGELRLATEIDVSEPGTLELTIEDDDGPVEGVMVNLLDRTESDWVEAVSEDGIYTASTHDDASAFYTTDEDGEIHIERLEQRDYRVHVTDDNPGYFTNQTEVSLDAETVTQEILIESGNADVTFVVADDHFDEPQSIDGATIEILDRGDTFSVDGERELSLPVNDNYEIELRKDDYDSVSETVELGEEDQTVELFMQRTPLVDLDVLNEQVVVGGTNQVTVTNAYDEPVEGATITVDGVEVGQTNENGQLNFVIEDDGEHTVAVEYEGLSDSVTVEAFEPGDEDAPDDIAGIDEDDDEDDDEADDDDDDADDDGAGFGIAVAALAGILALTVAVRRARSR